MSAYGLNVERGGFPRGVKCVRNRLRSVNTSASTESKLTQKDAILALMASLIARYLLNAVIVCSYTLHYAMVREIE